jgi:hypothetical protein
LCIIKGRENPEKAAKSFAAQTNSPIPLLRDLLTGVRLRQLIDKRADDRLTKEPTVNSNKVRPHARHSVQPIVT